jgi:hypothetical protein
MISIDLFSLPLCLEFTRDSGKRVFMRPCAYCQKGIYTGRTKGTTKAKPRRAKELKKQSLTAPEIAQILHVSERTVWRYLTGQ